MEDPEVLCPYEVELHCDEIVDYDTLTQSVSQDSPIWDESSCESSTTSSMTDPMDMMDHLAAEQSVYRQREVELQTSLQELQAQRNRLRDEQLFYLSLIPRDECLTRYGLLWSTSAYCPQCRVPLRECTQCTYHSHSSTVTGQVYWFLGSPHPDHCLLCLLDSSTTWTSLKVTRSSES